MFSSIHGSAPYVPPPPPKKISKLTLNTSTHTLYSSSLSSSSRALTSPLPSAPKEPPPIPTMKDFLQVLPKLDDSSLQSVQEAIHKELSSRTPKPIKEQVDLTLDSFKEPNVKKELSSQGNIQEQEKWKTKIVHAIHRETYTDVAAYKELFIKNGGNWEEIERLLMPIVEKLITETDNFPKGKLIARLLSEQAYLEVLGNSWNQLKNGKNFPNNQISNRLKNLIAMLNCDERKGTRIDMIRSEMGVYCIENSLREKFDDLIDTGPMLYFTHDTPPEDCEIDLVEYDRQKKIYRDKFEEGLSPNRDPESYTISMLMNSPCFLPPSIEGLYKNALSKLYELNKQTYSLLKVNIELCKESSPIIYKSLKAHIDKLEKVDTSKWNW